MSDITELQKRALEIRQRYDELNDKSGNNKWGGKEYAMGFVGDVGDLLKLVMAKEGLRRKDDVDAKLEHELSDCLWSVLVIADHYKIDVEAAFARTMDALKVRLSEATS
jgi:NTP pyrophosphatase (non-canonical NTP hydrolase)